MNFTYHSIFACPFFNGFLAANILHLKQHARIGKQRLREARIQAVDYLILLLAGACLGSLVKVSDQNFGADGYTYTIIAVCKWDKFSAGYKHS